MTDKIADAQSRVDANLVARMIVEFQNELHGRYGAHTSLTAVGPLQAMIGLAIKNGHLKLGGK